MKELTLTLIGMFVLLGGIFFGSFELEKAKCYKRYSDFEVRWQIPEGCMIKPNSKWIPSQNYREL